MANKFWYIGSADVKIMSTADWNAVGAGGQTTATWDSSVRWGLDSTIFNTNATTWLNAQIDFALAATDPLARPPTGNTSPGVGYLTRAMGDALYAPAGATDLVIRYVGMQPLRISVTSDPTRRVRWVSPTPPTVGNGYAIDGLDVWENTSS